MRETLRYEQLPETLISSVSRDDFIKGHYADRKSIILWSLNREAGRQQESEYCLSKQRILSRTEREEKLPADEEIALPDQGFRVVKRYRLELDTDVLYEVYDVYPEDARTRFFTCEQIYYSRVLSNVGEVVSAAARKLSFPVVYGGWSRHDRVAYWVRALYRLRHRTGETGTSEDDVFGPGLIDEMKQLDCEIDSVLPDVLRALARMESMDPQRLIKSFNTRTGTEKGDGGN